mgnify:CR=1 FL=1
MFKKYFSLLLCLTLMLCASLAAAEYTPGTYEGTAAGFGGDITAKVTVTENEIVSIDFAEHKETVGVSDPAFAKLPDAIIEAQSVGVDTVSGCTFSSQGILNAVKAALLAAGADETEITKKVEAAPSEPKETLEYTADVVIIGAGGAGMSAALEAKQAGADAGKDRFCRRQHDRCRQRVELRRSGEPKEADHECLRVGDHPCDGSA